MTLSIETLARIDAQDWMGGLDPFPDREALALALAGDTFACWIEDNIKVTFELDDDEEFPMNTDERAEYARVFTQTARGELNYIVREIEAYDDANSVVGLAHWASYLINSDPSGLTPEDTAEIAQWMKYWNIESVEGIVPDVATNEAREPFAAYVPAIGVAGSCLPYYVTFIGN